MSPRLLLLGLALGAALPAQDAKIPLTVAFVGDVEARTKEFTDALAGHFQAVTAHEHGTKPAVLAKADVVVLDWQQKVDAIQKWSKDEKLRAAACPLGARAEWNTPTVLLGSAGLNLACAWEVKGGFG
jgi:hypothetical protein